MKTIKILFCFILISLNLKSQEIRILEHKSKIKIKKLRQLNSRFRETNLCISPNAKTLYFMTSRGGQKWSKQRMVFGRKQYDGDIWYSEKKDGKWQKPKPMPSQINTSAGEDEPNILPDGYNVFYQSWCFGWNKDGGPYYMAKLKGKDWLKPKGMGGGINQFFVNQRRVTLELATDGVAMNPTGDCFIVAYGHDYDGKMDIYMSIKGFRGNWSYLHKLPLSTPEGDERSAFLAADGKTFFFASDAYGGFGGLDIFKTTIDKEGNIGEIINIGKPFNTEQDDFGFILAASGQEAYFVRDGDIYFANLSKADSLIKPIPVKIIEGEITDSLHRPLEAKIELRERPNGKIIYTSESNLETGRFLIVVPPKLKQVYISTHLEGYDKIQKKYNFENPEIYEELKFDFTLKEKIIPVKEIPKEEKKDTIEIEKQEIFFVYFDIDKFNLKAEYQNIIKEKLSKIKAENIISIKIEGHTDSDAGNDYNLRLGENRAEVVKQFLLKQNINKNKVKTQKSFGENSPITTNKTDKGKQKNRRSKIEIKYKQKP